MKVGHGQQSISVQNLSTMKATESMTEKIKRQMAGREKCEIHNAYKVAWDAELKVTTCNQCLFLKQRNASASESQGIVKLEEHEFNQHHMFTALMTRELKTKFDREYKTYKDSLCDVAEIDHENVKQLLLSQAKNFFGSMRSKVASLRHDVNQKIQSSKALI